MIIEFSTQNYRSFKELTTCSFVRAKSIEDSNIMSDSRSKEVRKNLRVFNDIVVYTESHDMIKNLFDILNEFKLYYAIPKEEYLEHLSRNVFDKEKPVFFELCFTDNSDLTMYRFGYEANLITQTLETYFFMKKKEDKKEICLIKAGKLNKKYTPDEYKLFEDVLIKQQLNKPLIIKDIKDMKKYTETTQTEAVYIVLDAIIKASKEDRMLLIDDLDFKLNPYEKRELINEIRSRIYNKHYPNAQMIFSSRDLVFLSGIFEADQINFINGKTTRVSDNVYEKTQELYALCEFKNYNKYDWMKGYLHGRFSAVTVNPIFSYLTKNLEVDL